MSYTLSDVRREYDRLDALCGVDTSGIELVISTRGVYQLGCCRYKNSKPVQISITDFVFSNDDVFWDTIRHEYAHALVKLRYPKESHGHDQLFYAACREVGCDARRLSRFAKEESRRRKESRTKYIVECAICHRQWRYIRAGKVVQGLQSNRRRRYLCPLCHTASLKLVVDSATE